MAPPGRPLRRAGVGDAHPPPLPGEAVAAARAPHAAQDARPHQLLHDLLEVAPRQIQAPRDVLALHRFRAAVEGNVGHGLERQNQLF